MRRLEILNKNRKKKRKKIEYIIKKKLKLNAFLWIITFHEIWNYNTVVSKSRNSINSRFVRHKTMLCTAEK